MIPFLPLRMGETGESDRNPGLIGSAIIPIFPANPERFSGEISRYSRIRDQG